MFTLSTRSTLPLAFLWLGAISPLGNRGCGPVLLGWITFSYPLHPGTKDLNLEASSDRGFTIHGMRPTIPTGISDGYIGVFERFSRLSVG
jgi:hypothetical protein